MTIAAAVIVGVCLVLIFSGVVRDERRRRRALREPIRPFPYLAELRKAGPMERHYPTTAFDEQEAA